ncbi:hypothetical protein ACFQ51_16240 [Streptomyces kaempferi]
MRTIAAAAAEAWNSGCSRSATCSTRVPKADMSVDMDEPSEGLVVPESKQMSA